MRNLILLTVLILIMGCSNNSDSEPVESFPKTIIPVLIGKSSVSNPIPLLQNVLISSQKDWNILLNSVNAANNVSINFTETNIDFSNFDVIAVFRNQYSNSSSTVDITKIVENQTNRVVTIQNLINGISQDVAQPFHIVKIPKSNKPVVFQ